MPDLGKVIRGLECCTKAEKDCKNCPIGFGFGCGLQLKRQARILLAAQQPAEPIYVEDDETWVCGSCGAIVGETFLGVAGEGEVRDKCCPECGRAVQWDG